MFLQIGLDSLLLSLFAFDLLLLLLHKLGGDSPDVVLGTTQVLPQLPQEHSGVLWVQEAGQVDLHLLGVGELLTDKLDWRSSRKEIKWVILLFRIIMSAF